MAWSETNYVISVNGKTVFLDVAFSDCEGMNEPILFHHGPAGEPSTSPSKPFTSPLGFMGNSGGSSLRKFPHDFLTEIQGKWREFSMCIFLSPFAVESLGKFLRGNFPRASLKNFKMQFNHIGRVPVMWKYPSDDLMSFFGELKCLQVRGNFPLNSTPVLKFSLNFHVDSRFTYNPNFSVDSLHQQPQSRFCPLGVILCQ